MASARVSCVSVLIAPYDIAPVLKRVTRAVHGSTSSSGIACAASPSGAPSATSPSSSTKSRRPRSVQAARLRRLTSAAKARSGRGAGRLSGGVLEVGDGLRVRRWSSPSRRHW